MSFDSRFSYLIENSFGSLIFFMYIPKSTGKILKYCYSLIKDELQFTPAFQEALKKKLVQRQPAQFLRLEIIAGEGCEGFTYKFHFDNNLNQSDYVTVNQKKQIEFAIGSDQIPLVQGSMLDYVTEMMRQTFIVKENPNAEFSCSCKTSFSPKNFEL